MSVLIWRIVGFCLYILIMRWLVGTRRRANIGVCLALGLLTPSLFGQSTPSLTGTGLNVGTAQIAVWTGTSRRAVKLSWRQLVHLDYDVNTYQYGYYKGDYASFWTYGMPRMIQLNGTAEEIPQQLSATVQLFDFGSYIFGSIEVYNGWLGSGLYTTKDPQGKTVAYYGGLMPGTSSYLSLKIDRSGSFLDFTVGGETTRIYSAPAYSYVEYPTSVFSGNGRIFAMSTPWTGGQATYADDLFGFYYRETDRLASSAPNDPSLWRRGMGGVQVNNVGFSYSGTSSTQPTTNPTEREEDSVFGKIASTLKEAQNIKDSDKDGTPLQNFTSLLEPCKTGSSMADHLIIGMNLCAPDSVEKRVFGGDTGITYDAWVRKVGVQMDEIESTFSPILTMLRVLGTGAMMVSCMWSIWRMFWWATGMRGYQDTGAPILAED